MPRLSRLVLAASVGFASTPALASPWTLPGGQLVVSSSFDFQFANSEFIDRGGERAFPLEGQFFGGGLTLSARLGMTDAIELEGSFPLRIVSFQADPVILRAAPADLAGPGALAFYQDNLVDFSQTGAGVADISLRGRYRFLAEGAWVSTLELGLRTPTGYREPEGTFGAEPTTVEAFEARADELVRPENVRDDVVLGDGRLELQLSVLVGAAFETGTFVRGSGGYALRLRGAGDQLRTELKVGQSLGDRVLVFVEGRLAVTVESGESIGISAVATDPAVDARRFATGGITLIERVLERDALDVGGGLVWRVTRDVEVNLAYSRTVWGRFTAATHAFSFSTLYRLPVLGAR